MKRFSGLLFCMAFAALSFSCTKEKHGGEDEPVKTSVITARFAESKVSYSIESGSIKPSWVKDDWIVGFNDNSKTTTLIVKKINAQGVATLEGSPADGNYHLISEVSCTESKIVNGVYTVSYAQQSGDDAKVADVFVSEGTIANGNGDFIFNRAGGIVVICNAKGMEKMTVNKVEIFGSNLSEGEVALNASGKLELKGKVKANDSISVTNLNIPVSEADAALGSPVILGVPAGAKIDKISISNSADTYSYEFPASKEVVAGECIMVKELNFEKPKGEAVAVIGEAKFASIEEAFAAANAATSDVTVKLLKNAFLTNTIEITNASAAVTIDLAGFMVASGETCFTVSAGAKFTVSDTGKGGYISTEGNNTVTSKGGQINVVSGLVRSDMKAIYAEDNSEVNISGGSVTATDSCAVVLLFSKGTISGDAEITAANGLLISNATQNHCQMGAVSVLRSDIDITGGTITNGGGVGLHISGESARPCVANISGGTISGKHCGVFPYFKTTLNITGGYINQTLSTTKETMLYCCVYCKNTSGVAINISGGYYKAAACHSIKSGGEGSGKMFNITGGKYNIAPDKNQYINLPEGYTAKSISEGDYFYEVVKK